MPSIFQIKDKIFYGWIIVVSIVTISFLVMGIGSSFGAFFTSLENTFDLTRAATSMILSGRLILCGVFAVVGGWAIDRYGPKIVISIMGFFIGLSLMLTAQTTDVWQLFITYSLLLAVGTGANYVVIVAAVSRWFDRRRGLALGIAGSGSGLGLTLIVPFSAFLIDNYEWRNALMILGGIAWLVIISVSQFLKKDPHEIGSFPDGITPVQQTSKVKGDATSSQRIPLLQLLQTRNFWIFLFIWLLLALSWYFVMTHIIPHAVDLGFSAIESAVILSIFGIAMIIGRLTAGILTDKLSAKVVAITCALLQAMSLLCLVWVQELWMLYLFGLIHGFTSGGFDTPMTVIISRTFNLSGIGKIIGILQIGVYIGGAIGPFLGGLIFDTSNSYTLAFLIMTGIILIRIILVMLVKQKVSRAR